MLNPITLAIETATTACSAALLVNEKSYHVYELAPKEHTKRIFPMIDSLLNQAKVKREDIQLIAVSIGPGSFTGVRLGFSLAQGLAFGLNIPLLGISTLEALAYDAKEMSSFVIPALDARMGEVYAGLYRSKEEGLERVNDEKVATPEKLLELSKQYPDAALIGSGWDYYFPKQSNLIGDKHPNALSVAKIAEKRWQAEEKGEGLQIKPSYLRNDVAKKSKCVTT